MDPDGANVSALTRFRPGFNAMPAWTPDGSTIVFVHSDDSGTDLYTVPSGGGGVTRLTNTPRLIERSPEWSADGASLLFSRVRPTGGADEDLFTITADGSDLTRLGPTEFNDFQASWSPDAARIVFVRETARLRVKAFMMDADGTDVTRLTGGATDEFWPSFSPTARRLCSRGAPIKRATCT
jgi:TolB protein